MTLAADSGVRTRSALAQARRSRGWNQQIAAREYQRVAAELNIPAAGLESLRITLSRWENGRQAPDEDSRRVLRRLYNLTDIELGLSNVASPVFSDEAADLAARLVSSTRVDAGLVLAFSQTTHVLRLQDRTFGAAVLQEQMSAHVGVIQTHLDHSMSPTIRQSLARVLADAGALAGWQALDAGATTRAWSHFILARQAAIEAETPALLAHALGEQAYALLEAGHARQARELIQYAAALGSHPPLLQAWLAAAEGEFAASEGDTVGAFRAFDRAQKLLPLETADEALPFLALNDTHLTRWRGSALARLGHPDAITDLTVALAAIDQRSFVRALTGLHTDLATAHAVAGDRDQARAHIRAAHELATQIGSGRLLRRLNLILLPRTRSQNVQ